MAAAFDGMDPELVADVESAFLGHWERDVMEVVRGGYEPGAIRGLAHRIGVDEGGE